MKKTTMSQRGDTLDNISVEPVQSMIQDSNTPRVKKDMPQPAREENIKAIVAFFKSGISHDPGRLGIELEHTVVTRPDEQPVSYSQNDGVLWVLQQLEDEYPKKTYDAEGDLLGLARAGEAITLEPAAQIELSAGPFDTLVDAERVFNDFEDQLGAILSSVGEEAVLTGYHPTAKARDLDLIPKRRYKFMNLYLGEISEYGPCMMRGSASTQVSIDYDSPEDCLRKLRLAFALVPLFSLITDNSPVFEGKPRTHQLVRTKIWQNCDPKRCGLVPGAMEPGFTLEDYAAYILDTPAILIPCRNHEWCYSEKTFGEIYAEKPMKLSDVEHAVSMLFNDVRLKTYLEIRPADAMPVPYVLAYTALIKALFYYSENLDLLDVLFKEVSGSDVEEAKDRLMADGYQAIVYGRPVSELIDVLIQAAEEKLDETDRAYLEPLATLTKRRVTLADIAEQKR